MESSPTLTLCRGWIPGLSGSQGAKSNRSAVFVFSLLFFTQTDSDPSRGMFLLEAMHGYMTHTHTQAQIQAHVHLRRYACTVHANAVTVYCSKAHAYSLTYIQAYNVYRCTCMYAQRLTCTRHLDLDTGPSQSYKGVHIIIRRDIIVIVYN